MRRRPANGVPWARADEARRPIVSILSPRGETTEVKQE